ncbi:MAG: glycosyltransferase family 2 protein [Eubacteriales bacterium]|jgi:cellulose synthase/poly-beta-1,6-N-acetylglucosamine synthase-like glycosyltransferase
MKILFWATAALTFYTFFLYPVFLSLLVWITLKRRPEPPGLPNKPEWPRVSLIIAAHNEEKVIEKKLLNTAELDYPPGKLEVIVVSDNSTDSTNELVRKYENKGVILVEVDQRRGKTFAQNQAARVATGKILFFSDANSIWEKDALWRLAERFENPRTGYVCGRLKYVNEETGSGFSEGLYWRYELSLRFLESRLFSVTAGNGAVYAVRAGDYMEIDDLYCHDLELPHELVKRGKLALYEPAAVGCEKAAGEVEEEYARKVRMLSRTWRRILTGPSLYNPFKYGAVYSWMMISHRLLRYLVPFFQIIIFGSSWFLRNSGPVYAAAFAAQLAFYALALAGKVFKLENRLFFVPYYFCMFNLASLVGFFKAQTGNVSPVWEKADSTR